MRYARPLFITAAALVVLWQLVHINVHLPIGTFSYGVISERVEKAALTLTRYAREVTRALQLTTTHDSIVFVGDVLLARNVEHIMRREGASLPFEGLSLHALGARPAIVGNFESSMATPHVMTPAFQMRFSTDPELLGGLTTARFTHLSLANNHSFDYGEDAYRNAATTLTEQGFSVFGHGREINENSVTYLKTKEGPIALIGIHATDREPDMEALTRLMKEAEKRSTMQIAYIHWGTEYIVVHSKAQERIAKTLVDAGVDLIIGHHPHVVQDVDLIDGVVVFYSLGNYVFDQYFSKDVMEGLVVVFDLGEEPMLNLFPVTSEFSLSKPTLMSPESHAAFLQALAKRSAPALQEHIERGMIPLLPAVATSTEMAIMVR